MATASCVRNVRPPMISYAPSMWRDIFSNFSFDDQMQETYVKSTEAIKKQVRSMLLDATSSKLIILLDTIERLGLAYHFEMEIEEKLHEIYNFHANGGDMDEEFDLFTTALWFRLLRQHQYQVSCNVFDKFIGKDNKFEEILSSDVEGLLSLYEAAHARIHGESILEEAIAFTTHHLTRLEPQLEPPSKDKVQHTLQHSLHRGVPIIHSHHYISIYEREDSRNEVLLQLAKLNFNFLQNLYKKELCELLRWWNKFDLKSELVYARDRMVESYLWGVGIHFEPQYSDVRIAVAKSIQMISIMDDTYDNYATLEEAELLTQILERWNIEDIDLLPDYMKTVYRFIMSIYEDYERDAARRETSFAVPYFREAVKQIGAAYNQEQIWIMEGRMPTFEEYITNGEITSCIYVMFTAAVLGMKSVTKEEIDRLLISEPKIIKSTAKMTRLLDDLGTHERENREGKLLTVVDCYMKDHNVSKQEALSKFAELVEDGWKDVNTEWATRTSARKEMVEQLLNYARMCEVTYKNGEDAYTNPEKFLAPQIASLFVDPIII